MRLFGIFGRVLNVIDPPLRRLPRVVRWLLAYVVLIPMWWVAAAFNVPERQPSSPFVFALIAAALNLLIPLVLIRFVCRDTPE